MRDAHFDRLFVAQFQNIDIPMSVFFFGDGILRRSGRRPWAICAWFTCTERSVAFAVSADSQCVGFFAGVLRRWSRAASRCSGNKTVKIIKKIAHLGPAAFIRVENNCLPWQTFAIVMGYKKRTLFYRHEDRVLCIDFNAMVDHLTWCSGYSADAGLLSSKDCCIEVIADNVSLFVSRVSCGKNYAYSVNFFGVVLRTKTRDVDSSRPRLDKTKNFTRFRIFLKISAFMSLALISPT